MKNSYRFRQRLLDYFPNVILALALLLFLASVYYFSQWKQAIALNKAFDDQSLMTQVIIPANYLHAYSVGYLLAQNDKPMEAMEAFDFAELTPDPYLRAITKHALANLHAYTAEASLDDEHGSRRLVERILLAREAYKGALRLVPELYATRFNLERLDRISPAKRTAGSTMIDGYTVGLDPFKQNGRALMKDNTRRGLP